MTRVFEIQAQGPYGDWDSEYVSGDPGATLARSATEAQKIIAALCLHWRTSPARYRAIIVEREEAFLVSYGITSLSEDSDENEAADAVQETEHNTYEDHISVQDAANCAICNPMLLPLHEYESVIDKDRDLSEFLRD